LTCKAEYFNQCGEYQKCFELTSEWVFNFFQTEYI
jgi:hypothetical protein